MCTTKYSNKHGCPGLHMDVDVLGGGDSGAETITWQDPGNFYYLMFVHDYSNDHVHSLTQSGAHVALYGNSQDQVTRFKVPADEATGHGRLVEQFVYIKLCVMKVLGPRLL